MNIFSLPMEEFENKLDEIFSNVEAKELLEELKECGLEVKQRNIKEMSINEFKKEVDKFLESMTSNEILDKLEEYKEEQMTKVVGFASDNMQDLCKEIENYAEMFNLKIQQISAYVDAKKVMSQRVIVVFEKEN